MKTRIALIYILSLLAFSPIHTEIIETPSFKELEKHVTPNSLLVLDIDDTLLIPVQTLGTDVWFRNRIEQNKTAGMSDAEAKLKTIEEWEAIRKITKVKLVEPETDLIVRRLQDKGIPVMAMTTQGLALASCTIPHLYSLNIDLRKTSPHDADCYFINQTGVLYRDGVLFTSGTPKGEALLKFFNQAKLNPKHVVFINDNGKYLHEVEKVLEAHGIAFTGLRYSYSDERINNYRSEIADLQWQLSSFHTILSDEEAEHLHKQFLKINQHLNP